MADTNVPDAEAIYFAGFFDGEGSVGIYIGKYIACLANTDVRPLQRAKARWGGQLYRIPPDKRVKATMEFWHWQIYGHKSRQFLEDILPFSVVKRQQIEIFLSILDVIPRSRGEKLKPGVAEAVSNAIVRLKALKRGA